MPSSVSTEHPRRQALRLRVRGRCIRAPHSVRPDFALRLVEAAIGETGQLRGAWSQRLTYECDEAESQMLGRRSRVKREGCEHGRH